MSVAAPELEKGTDESVSDFYNSRVTGCEFLEDPNHYEYPRAAWVLDQVSGGSLLEIGCGNGGMTRLLAPRVDRVVAFDVSAPSLRQLEEMQIPNVETVQGLVENFKPERTYNWVILSEVIEHLRDPMSTVRRALEFVSPGGTLVITTPNGHWESDEHLHEFSLQSLVALLAQLPCEGFRASYLRDRDNRRRWLTATVDQADLSPADDDFFNRKATARKRKSN